MRYARSVCMSIICLALLAGCGGAPKKVKLDAHLVGTESINPNRDGRPSPVTVVIYQLKKAEAFESRDFFNLYNPDSNVLADDLVQRTDIQIRPGQAQQIDSEFDPETKYIGVIAAFRDIDQANWRAVVPLPDRKLKKFFRRPSLTVTVDRLTVTAAVGKP